MTTPSVELAEFAARLQALLDERANGNQSALARAVKCSPQAVNKWLLGEGFPRAGLLPKVAEFFHVTPAYLRYGHEDGKPQDADTFYILMYVHPREAKILTNYREGTEVGKKQLELSSSLIEKLPKEKLDLMLPASARNH